VRKNAETLAGERNHHLLAVKLVGRTKAGAGVWECVCDCGNVKHMTKSNFKRNKSCGCMWTYYQKESHKTHGQKGGRLYQIWRSMKQRCGCENSINYKYYGGRGVKVCDEWGNSFEAFRDWAINNGYAETLTLDRIDNDGDYTPDNCRWSTPIEQANNRTSNVKFASGETLAEYSRRAGVSYREARRKWEEEKTKCTT